MNFLWFILFGAIAGFLASLIVRGKGMSFLGDIVVGIIGGVIGGLIVEKFNIHIASGLLGDLIVSTGGAVILLLLLNLFRKKSS